MEDINADESKSLAKTLTESHPATVYGMAKTSPDWTLPSGYSITSLRVKKVTNQKCDIAIMMCRGDLCEMKSGTYHFDPPLQSGKDLLDNRLKEIHNQVCAPKVHWLATNPLALIVLVTCLTLAYGTLLVGVDGMVDAFAQAPRLEAGISTIFGSTFIFANCVIGAFWFSIIAHAIESGMSYRLCTRVLQLETGPTVTWMVLVFSVGYPILSQLQALAETQQKDEKSK
jgi:hypothetical protein